MSRRRKPKAEVVKVENGQSTVIEYSWGEYLGSLPLVDEIWRRGASEWTDNESFASAFEKMAHGDDQYVAMADALLDKLSNLSEGVPVREWAPDVIGAYCVVPEVLIGIPEAMRSLSPAGELSPVKIVISSTCSAGIDKETMTKRGVAILALLMKLQAIRPVELQILVEGNVEGRRNLFEIITVDTKPLSVSHACFAIANVGFARALTYAHMHHYCGWDGRWPVDYKEAGYEKLVREACGMSQEDLWIKSSYFTDSLLKEDPLAWVNQQLDKYTNREN